MKHYSREELDAYKHKDMSFLKRLSCKSHLLFCRKCQEVLNSLYEDEMLISDLKSSLENLKVSPDEEGYKTLCTLFHDEGKTSTI